MMVRVNITGASWIKIARMRHHMFVKLMRRHQPHFFWPATRPGTMRPLSIHLLPRPSSSRHSLTVRLSLRRLGPSRFPLALPPPFESAGAATSPPTVVHSLQVPSLRCESTTARSPPMRCLHSRSRRLRPSRTQYQALPSQRSAPRPTPSHAQR